FKESAPIAFSSKEKRDRLTVSVNGEECGEAIYRIVVQDPSGREIYRYEVPYEHQTGDPCDPDSVERFIAATPADACIKTTSSYPDFPKPEEADSLWDPQVDRETYDRLRAADLPVLNMSTGYESWQDVVYDSEQGKGVVVVEGGT